MKLKNIGSFRKIGDFVSWKINKFSKEEKNFKNLFENMFLESDNTFAEFSKGYHISKITYKECKDKIIKKASYLKGILNFPKGSIIGINMDNSIEWIEVFWCLLMCGYNPLLLNKRLDKDLLDKIINEHNVLCVISDDVSFNVQTIYSKDLLESNELVEFDVWGSEVFFLSSGTTENVKLCSYNTESFYYQLLNSCDIVKRCKQIANHYEGELKHLVILPFYHIFGFIAVYLWFGFFSRTLVFPNDLNPKTIQNTVRLHKVTHIFAVPLVWETVYKKAMRKINERDPKTIKKFNKGIEIAVSSRFGSFITHKAMKEVRDELFGESIQFLISGGSAISNDVIKFFNGIGYPLSNGYGMTEIGITSVEISPSPKVKSLGSIGKPFIYTTYEINENSELLIKGKNLAYKVIQGQETKLTNYNEFFNSNDVCEKIKGNYYLRCRTDDLLISSTGENLNPTLIEQSIHLNGVKDLCLLKVNNDICLLISLSNYSINSNSFLELVKKEINRLNLQNEIKQILLTYDDLLDKNDIKISRKKISKKILNKEITLFDESNKEALSKAKTSLEHDVLSKFSKILDIEIEKITLDAHFFQDLGGSSLEFFMLSDAIDEDYQIDLKKHDLYCVKDICEYLSNRS